MTHLVHFVIKKFTRKLLIVAKLVERKAVCWYKDSIVKYVLPVRNCGTHFLVVTFYEMINLQLSYH